MGKVKQINIKRQTYYYLNDIKTNKKSYKNIGIYNIGYITKKIDDCKNIHSVNPLYLLIDHAADILKEKMKMEIYS